VSVKKGVDPRETCDDRVRRCGDRCKRFAIAREIFIPKVIIPKVPGTFSGAGHADGRRGGRISSARCYGLLGSLDAKQVDGGVRELAEAGKAQVARDGYRPAPPILPTRRSSLRRPGAHHRHPVRDPKLLSGDVAPLREAFRRRARPALRPGRARRAAGDRQRPSGRHSGAGGHAGRALAVGEMDAGAARSPTSGATSSSPIRPNPLRTRIVWRPSLPAGATIEGPAVIEEPNATTFIHPGDIASISDAGHLIIDVKP
jgi:N-methylhydantoinase A